jgi:phage tail sheath gpL-like
LLYPGSRGWCGTWTATVKGLHPNSCGFRTIKTPSITTTCTWLTAAAGGAALGTVAPVITTALTNMLPVQTPVIVCPWDDSATLTLIRAHLLTKAAAPSQLSCSLICAETTTAALLATHVATLDTNDCERICYVGVTNTVPKNSNMEIAALMAAVNAAEPHLARSLNNLALVGLKTPAVSDGYTRGQLKTLLQGGVTPLYVPVGDDTVRICRAISARSDLGIMDFALMTTLDYCRDRMSAVLSNRFRRMSIVDDDEPIAASHVTTVSIVKMALKSEMLSLGVEGYLTDVEENWDSVVCTWDASAGVLALMIPTEMLPQWHQTLVQLAVEV